MKLLKDMTLNEKLDWAFPPVLKKEGYWLWDTMNNCFVKTPSWKSIWKQPWHVKLAYANALPSHYSFPDIIPIKRFDNQTRFIIKPL